MKRKTKSWIGAGLIVIGGATFGAWFAGGPHHILIFTLPFLVIGGYIRYKTSHKGNNTK